MGRATITELAASLEELQAQMAEISQRLAVLEKHEVRPNGATVLAGVPVAAAPVPAAPAGISEAELLAISAALGAYLGVRAHIRQIRLVSTTAWAQEGRVSIQASHRL
jgi:methylmalonyl-CoA carboxyltransferase large subunit